MNYLFFCYLYTVVNCSFGCCCCLLLFLVLFLFCMYAGRYWRPAYSYIADVTFLSKEHFWIWIWIPVHKSGEKWLCWRAVIFLEKWINFGTVQVVHFKCSDKCEPSLTLRVYLNKNWPILIGDTLVVRTLPTVSMYTYAHWGENWGVMNISN